MEYSPTELYALYWTAGFVLSMFFWLLYDSLHVCSPERKSTKKQAPNSVPKSQGYCEFCGSGPACVVCGRGRGAC